MFYVFILFYLCRCIKPQLKSLALGFHALATRTLGKTRSVVGNVLGFDLGLTLPENLCFVCPSLVIKCLFRFFKIVFAVTCCFIFRRRDCEKTLFPLSYSRDPSTHLLWSHHWHHMSKMGPEKVWGHRSLSNLQHHRLQVVLTHVLFSRLWIPFFN